MEILIYLSTKITGIIISVRSDYILRHLRWMGNRSSPDEIFLDFFFNLKPILSYCYFPKTTNGQLYMKNIGRVPVHGPFWREKHNETGILTVSLFTRGNVFHADVFNSHWACSGLAVEIKTYCHRGIFRYSPYSFMAPKLFRQVLITDNKRNKTYKFQSDVLYRKNDILELDCKISNRQNLSLSAVSGSSACAALLLALTHWSGECASRGI